MQEIELPGDIWCNGMFVADETRFVPDDQALPSSGSILVTLDRLLGEPALCDSANRPLGVLIAPADMVERLEGALARVRFVAVLFEKFGDGRSYSSARLLRDRFAFRGEIRAVGDVLFDQLRFMARCGIDAFVIANAPTRVALLAGKRPAVDLHLQPAQRFEEMASDARPFLRRAVTSI